MKVKLVENKIHYPYLIYKAITLTLDFKTIMKSLKLLQNFNKKISRGKS